MLTNNLWMTFSLPIAGGSSGKDPHPHFPLSGIGYPPEGEGLDLEFYPWPEGESLS
jgi:hypothetical protein